MGLPRSRYVKEGEEGLYHCFSRCVRRAFLYGYDAVTNRDFSHRKAWLVERLKYLAAIFAIEVCAYAIMGNHYHVILRIRPDIVALWSDWEVATRWLTLFPRRRSRRGAAGGSSMEEDIRALASCPERIAKLRRRLCSLSWFMGRLNEHIARAANREDGVKGRFWESRFKSQALLDEAALTACMVYVDLNPVRAGLAATPEESDFTSIQERIRAWQIERLGDDSAAGPSAQDVRAAQDSDPGTPSDPASWLCPISSDSSRRGILQMTQEEYFELVDHSGRAARPDGGGVIPADLAPILTRIGANPDAWVETISKFGSNFCMAAGLLVNLRSFAHIVGRCWLKGLTNARISFAS